MATIRGLRTELFPIAPRDWDRLEALILEFERKYFPPGLREAPTDLRRMIRSPTGIVIGVRAEGLPLAGYVASDVLECFREVPWVQHDPHWGRGTTHYIAAVVVVPPLRHQGLATKLTKEAVRRAEERGFRRVTAHILAGAAQKIDRRVEVLGRHDNWYGTGQAFEYVVFRPEVTR